MTFENKTKELIAILFIALCSSRLGLADDRSVLHYDHPIAENLKRLDHSVPRSQINARFMGQALPLGNGRFGAMFSGHVDSEYLVFNDITLWMNSTRGESEFKQSGSPADGKDYLELVRAACREGKYGTRGRLHRIPGNQVSRLKTGTWVISRPLPILRYGPDMIRVRRMTTIERWIFRPAWGAFSYRVGDVTYSREYFCSYPQDLFVARFTADGGTMDLVLEARTAQPKNTIESKGREIHLRGSAAMDRDDMEFMQAVRVVAGDAKVEAKADGSYLRVHPETLPAENQFTWTYTGVAGQLGRR